MAALLRKLKIAAFGQSWPEMWAQSSARLEAAAIKARDAYPEVPVDDIDRLADELTADVTGWHPIGWQGAAQHTYTRACDGFHEPGPCPRSQQPYAVHTRGPWPQYRYEHYDPRQG